MCIIAVDANFVDRLPVFGKLDCVWLANDEIIFEYFEYRVVGFSNELMAYQVVDIQPDDPTKFCIPHKMLDFNVYSIQTVNSELYIPLKYNLKDIINQHVVGGNPLHL